ncbi:MAG: transposase [Pseudomonadota bacterium]
MTRPRSTLISLEATPFYHCISRCVRRAFLCGKDRESGRSFDHRKTWLVQRFKMLAEVFAIDIPAYAVMSNHYHLVLHVDVARTAEWPIHEVIRRWNRLYHGPELVQRFAAGEELSGAELDVVHRTVDIWRSRLSSISWFMSCLNYHIALQANKEDGCKGRFWEGRFKSQALQDDAALLSCMAYVDLNPIRAGIAENLDRSDFTSIQQRIREMQGRGDENKPKLMVFAESASQDKQHKRLNFDLKDYVELVDWTGRIVRNDKNGYIESTQPKLLDLLRLSNKQWQVLALQIQKKSITMLHGISKLASMERKSRRAKAA